jgi:hypothetical protein
MLFHIKQVHSSADCPYGKGGSRSFYNAQAEGIKLLGVYGAFMDHTLFMLVEADDIEALHRFLLPGMHTCKAEITPVSDHAVLA